MMAALLSRILRDVLPLWPLLALSMPRQEAAVPLAELTRLAQAHDAEGLRRYLAKPDGPNPFAPIALPGAYTGPKEWSALPLTLPGEARPRFVAFSSFVIVEDLGDLLFSIGDDGKLTFVDERETFGDTIQRHRFDLWFDLPKGLAYVFDRVRLSRNPRSAADRPIVMRIGDRYRVTRVADGKGTELPFVQAGGTVAIKAGSDPNPELAISYQGNPGNDFMAKPVSEREATLAASVWYPMIGRRPTPYDLTARYPKDWIAVGQGEEVDSIVDDSERVTRFRMDVPAVWLSFSAGPFKRVVTNIGGREYATASPTMTPEAMTLQNRLSAEPIEFFSRTFGRYPFRCWTNLKSWVFGPGGGALEAYSYATYPDDLIPGVDGHETAHSWWGGMVNNDYLRSFWNESFATYSDELFMRERAGSRRNEARLAFAFPTASQLPFTGSPLNVGGDTVGPLAPLLGYVKGPMVLGVLEDEIGTKAMIGAMRRFLKTNPDRHVAEWEDFERAVNAETDRDYGWFFDQWVRRDGMPTFALTDAKWADGKLRGTVEFKGSPYRFHANLLVRTIDGKPLERRVEIAPDGTGRAAFSVATPRAASVVLDPWQTIPRNGSAADAPASLTSFLGRAEKVTVGEGPATLAGIEAVTAEKPVLEKPSGKLLLGSPETLCSLLPKAGLRVVGSKLTYDGTTVDLNHGGALALIDLPDGTRCAIGLGHTAARIPVGKARLIVFDEDGRLLRAKTAPVATGSLTRKIDESL